MITLSKLELIRKEAPVTAEALRDLQTQINAATLSPKTQLTVGATGSADALPANPAGFVTFTLNGGEYVMPFYFKS